MWVPGFTSIQIKSSDVEANYNFKQRGKKKTIINQMAAVQSAGFLWMGQHTEWAWWFNQCKLITGSAGERCRQRRSPQHRLPSTVRGTREGHILWVDERGGKQGYGIVMGEKRRHKQSSSLAIHNCRAWVKILTKWKTGSKAFKMGNINK